ncbi:lysozyme inhibitor LprI family protein [Pseudogemmobacter blasticus]|uniref:Lysozyme inhibitor LprI-like N-terminal domain-containing protein n=1 Tax=Fuscovulum blasticum DSM 2131 TaxID=1188250 RepID=A0A2T4J503_FUSBL|nr:lysozyme inhibitor LprI family protein [Fuscovulum blasticum]PTE12918.1 hypothetical protein C5F44_15940 [Fuscovulum blasticum DSM 2131]
MRILPALFLAVLAAPAAAQQVDCAKAMAQLELNWCAEQSWQAADAELNAAYKEAMALLQSWDADLPKAERGGAEALKQAQRAWITFRDKACEAEGYAMHGGSAEPMLIYGCRAQLTRDRTAQLRGLVGNYGGN